MLEGWEYGGGVGNEGVGMWELGKGEECGVGSWEMKTVEARVGPKAGRL